MHTAKTNTAEVLNMFEIYKCCIELHNQNPLRKRAFKQLQPPFTKSEKVPLILEFLFILAQNNLEF